MARPHARREHPFLRTVDRTVAPTLDPQGRVLIRLQTLGATTLLVGDARLDPSTGTLFSLLLRLAYAPEMRCARDTLLAELWHGQTPVRQRANLRQALYKLRQLGVRAGLVGEVVELDVGQVLTTFSLERTGEQFERDVTRGHEPFGLFLPAYVASSPDFQDWLDTEREAVHADVRRVLVGQLRTRRERADWSGAEALARWLLQFDPLNEDATLTVAECTALAGSKSEAVAILDKYLAELGIGAGDIRLPAAMLRRRIAEPIARGRISFAPTERHFMGREEELSVLTMMMRRARWHDGSVVLLHGTSGMGKTRLTSELAKVGALEGFRTMRVGCRELDAVRPLSVFLDLAPAMLSMPGALGCAPENLRMLKRWMPRAFVTPEPEPEIVETSAVIEPAISELDAPSVAPPYQVVSSLRRALIDLMAAVSDEKPLLLVVDDTHWIDETSWEVLADFIEHADSTRAFVVLTSREPHARATRPGRVPNALRVRPLHPLSAESSLALARAISDDLSAPLTDALGDWFVKASEGVPLFLRSLVNHWIESGEAGGVPPTLGEVIEQRLAKLSVTALLVLQTASALGDSATVSGLEEILELGVFEILAAIDELDKAHTLADRGDSTVSVHELLAQTAVAKLGVTAARYVHRRVALALVRRAREIPSLSDALRILTSWRAAADADSFSRYLILYAHTLLAAGDGGTLLKFADEAIVRCKDEHLDDLKLIRMQAEVECGLHTSAVRGDTYAVRFNLTYRATSPSDISELLSRMEAAFRADPSADREAIARSAILTSGDPRTSVDLRLRAADLGIRIAANLCSSELAREAYVSVDDVLPDPPHEEQSVAIDIAYHTIFGDMARAERAAKLLLCSAMKSVISTGRYYKLCRAAYALRICGDWGLAQSGFDEAQRNAEIEGTTALIMYPHWQLSVIALELDDREKARRHADILSEAFCHAPSDGAGHYVFSHLARLAIEAEEVHAAAAALLVAGQHLRKCPTAKSYAYHAALELGASLLQKGRSQPNDRSLLDVAIARHGGTARFGTSDYLTSVIGESLVASERHSEAADFIGAYLRTQRRDRGPIAAGLARVSAKVAAK